MKIKDLIRELQGYNPELDVWVQDEIEGNSCPLDRLEIYTKPYSNIRDQEDVLYIRWDENSLWHQKNCNINHYSREKQLQIIEMGFFIQPDGVICWSQDQVDKYNKEGQELYNQIKDSLQEPASPIPLAERKEAKELMEIMHSKIEDLTKNYNDDLDEPKEESYWLVFYDDHGNREDCSVFYSWLTKATCRPDAIAKMRNKTGDDAHEFERYDAIRINLI